MGVYIGASIENACKIIFACRDFASVSMPHLTFSAFFDGILGQSSRVSQANWCKPWLVCLGMAGFLCVQGLAFESGESGASPEAMRVYRPRHIVIDAETTAKGPVEVNLGEMGSAQRIYFTVEIKPVADDEILEEVQVTCSCVGLETQGSEPLLDGKPPFIGYFDTSWTADQVEPARQILTIQTSRRTIPIPIVVTALPTGSPEVRKLSEVDIATVSGRLRWEESLPHGAQVVRLEHDPRWATIGLDVQTNADRSKLIITLDPARAVNWFSRSVLEYPHVEQRELHVLYRNAQADESLVALNLQFLLAYSGHAESLPAKIDFGALRVGETATRRLEIRQARSACSDLTGPDSVIIRRLPSKAEESGTAFFELTFDTKKLPAPIHFGFADGVLRARLSNGMNKLVPIHYAIFPSHEHE